MGKAKILLAGSVQGNASVLVKKIKALQSSKAGPFDVCFCLGPWQSPDVKVDEETLLSQVKDLPLPVYLTQYPGFLSGGTDGDGPSKPLKIADNLFVLGDKNDNQAGLWELELSSHAKPLTVVSCPPHFRMDAAHAAGLHKSLADASFKGCDFLFTHDWPQGMDDIVNTDISKLSFDVCEIAMKCKPRYHASFSDGFHQSPAFRLPDTKHLGRFLSMGPVVPGKPAKTKKYIHALGIEPVQANPAPPTPDTPALPCPYANAVVNDDLMRIGGGPGFSRMSGPSSFSRFGNNPKRKRDNDPRNQGMTPPNDKTSTLFLYGIHNDRSGDLQSTQSFTLLRAFRKYKAKQVRHLPNSQAPKFCFLEFDDQRAAMECLDACRGEVFINGVRLTLKWANANNNANNKRSRQGDGPSKSQYPTQEEAATSTTLFFHPPSDKNITLIDPDQGDGAGADADADKDKGKGKDKDDADADKAKDDAADADNADDAKKDKDAEMAEAKKEEEATADGDDKDEDKKEEETEGGDGDGDDAKLAKGEANEEVKEGDGEDGEKKPEKPEPKSKFGDALRLFVADTLEHVINEGVEDPADRVTVETEPALKVEIRIKEKYGFLQFASHAAATMALAALTTSTDGGVLVPPPPSTGGSGGSPKPPSELVGTTLRWAKGEEKTGKDRKKKTSKDYMQALGLKRKHFPADARTDCWFCLASSTCEKHLITGVYETSYSTMPKGPAHPGHVLLVPVAHSSQGAWTMGSKGGTEILELKDRVKEHASKVYDMDLFVFERAIDTRGGYHTHVQCIPIPRGISTDLQKVMVAHAKASGFELRPIQSDLGITAMLSEEDNYFYAEVATDLSVSRFLYKAVAEDGDTVDAKTGKRRPRVPLQFGREVLASVLKKPELAHWKSCVVDQDKEAEMAATLRETLSEHT